MAIPTLTDIANRAVQGLGVLTGKIKNPFTEELRSLEAQRDASTDSDEIAALNSKINSLRQMADNWSSYEVAQQDPIVAKGLHDVARMGGDNFDLVDVGTAFVPIGAISKGAAFVGKRIPGLVAKGTEFAAKNPELWKNAKRMAKSGVVGQMIENPELREAAEVAAKHPILSRGAVLAGEHPVAARTLADATEQGLIEGAHGAATYRPEEGESIGLNALEQGGLAGILQGGVSALGGRRLRAIENAKKLREAQINSPENLKIKEGLSGLKERGVDVPEYDPVSRSGKSALTTGELAALSAAERGRVWGQMQNSIASGKRNPDIYMHQMVNRVEREMGQKVPKGKRRGNPDWTRYKKSLEIDAPSYYNQSYPLKVSPFEVEAREKMFGKELFPKNYNTGADIDLFNSTEYRNANRKDLYKALAGLYSGDKAERELADNIATSYFGQRWTTDYLDPTVVRQSFDNMNDLRGLSGLRYSKLPSVPAKSRMSKMYETQTTPNELWQRAVNNALLDAAREASEGGLDYLSDRYGR